MRAILVSSLCFLILLTACGTKQVNLADQSSGSLRTVLLREVEYDQKGLPLFVKTLNKRPVDPGERFTVGLFRGDTPVKTFDIAIKRSHGDFKVPLRIVYDWTGKGFKNGAAVGFVLALASIWMISQNGEHPEWRLNLKMLSLPLMAGIFFGFYFVAIHEATRQAFYWPLVSARLAGTLVMLVYAASIHGPLLPERSIWPLVILGGMLDVSGNAFYVLSAQTGRLDVAAVLGSLYPGSTVILAAILLKERISRWQGLGILMVLVAILLLTI